MSCEKLSLLREPVFAMPFAVSAGHAASMNLRIFCSAFGAGSVATTSKPWARNSAAQLAPITPVPTIAIFLTGLFEAIVILPTDAVIFEGHVFFCLQLRRDRTTLFCWGFWKRIGLSFTGTCSGAVRGAGTRSAAAGSE